MANDLPARSQVVKTFGAEAADFLEQAAALGWRIMLNSTNTSITLVPYDNGPKKIHLSSRNKNKGALRKHIKTLVRFADPACIAVADELAASDSIPEEAKSLLLQLHGLEQLGRDGGVIQMHDDEEETTKKDQRRQAKREAAAALEAQIEAKKEQTMPAVPPPTQVAERVAQERRIVSERPTLMHHTIGQRGGRSYPSQTTNERHYSDGTVEFVCRCCGETSENRRAFGGAHWAMHVRKGEAEAVDYNENLKNLVDDPNYTEPAWTRKATLREKRTIELKNLLDGLDLATITAEDLAKEIMEFLGDNGTGGGGGKAEPLTDSQVLDRIRTLVDRGTYADQEKAIFERDQQIEDLMSYSEQREQELAEKLLMAEQRATKAEATMGAFFELVQEMKGEGK